MAHILQQIVDERKARFSVGKKVGVVRPFGQHPFYPGSILGVQVAGAAQPRPRQPPRVAG